MMKRIIPLLLLAVVASGATEKSLRYAPGLWFRE